MKLMNFDIYFLFYVKFLRFLVVLGGQTGHLRPLRGMALNAPPPPGSASVQCLGEILTSDYVPSGPSSSAGGGCSGVIPEG